jgi:hypothetical protein
VCVSGTTRERDERSRVVDEENEVLFINPVLGPELVAGSSRLKGGSATKIILDAAFAVAATINEGRGTGHERGGSSSYDATATTLRDEAELYATRALSAFAAATRKTHASMSRDGACASACARAAAAVAAGGDVRLVSVAEFADVADVTPRVSKKETLSVSPLNETLGVTVSALVDASEQRPTFGTPLEKYRAFGGGGWRTLMYGSDDETGEEQRTRRKKQTFPREGASRFRGTRTCATRRRKPRTGKRKRKKARVSERSRGETDCSDVSARALRAGRGRACGAPTNRRAARDRPRTRQARR